MDFIVGLPKTQKGNDSIWVIVDRLTKVAHFLPVRTTYGGEKLAKLYIENIVKLHGVPSRIVSDRGTQFTSRFWKSLHKAMGTKLDSSLAYHPQTDGQTERVNQILEDMLRTCVLTYGKDWEQSLPYVEFSYNNGYQASLGMSPFEALYGRKCRTPLMWSEVGERALVGPALIKEAEKRVPVETIDLQPDLRYQEVPVKILDTVVRRTRTSDVQVCRVQWSRHGVKEATWEREDALKKEFPHLFEN
jgi:hypothetical protein